MGEYYNDKGILKSARLCINWDVKKITNYNQKVKQNIS